MRLRSCLLAGAVAVASIPNSAYAADIVLIDLGGVTGSPAEQGFKIAAAYWGSVLTNNVQIRLGVGFSALGTGIIGSTGSTRADFSVAQFETLWNSSKSSSTLDQTAILPTLNAQGGFQFITAGADAATHNNNLTQVYDNGATTSSKTLYLNTSVIKAIGGTVANPNTARDGNVTFSTNFSFDFNPTDGITAGQMDFIGVAIHEIGHALGFVSGVDLFDYYSGVGPGANSLGYDLNNTSLFSALDLFRYSTDPNGVAPGNAPENDLTVGGTKYFSIDGGATALYGNTFSTGAYNGDGRQASHWKDAAGCTGQLGILDPTFCYGQMGEITALDLAAYDAMGWNISVDALGNPGYKITTAQIYSQFAAPAVPEPATWAMMMVGFGLLGASMRRRAVAVSFG